MTYLRRSPTARHAVSHRATPRRTGVPKRTGAALTVTSAFAALALMATFTIAPVTQPTAADSGGLKLAAQTQAMTIASRVAATGVVRDGYSATPGLQSLAASGTNYAWAKMVLMSGGWPTVDSNVTVLVRWMRQENGTNNWWNRDNPLNNGLGSGGGGGTGSYESLVIAAQKAAENIQRNPVFTAVEAGFATAAPTAVIEQAIWASPWASSHYANGAHWHYTPVDEVSAPADAW